MVDVARVPKRFENRVSEAQHQNVLGGFFSKKMVDPIRLFLAERVADHAIELTRRSQITPERLFDDHARPTSFARLVQTDGFEMFEDRLELVGRDREIKWPVAACAAFLVDLVQAFRQTFEAG